MKLKKCSTTFKVLFIGILILFPQFVVTKNYFVDPQNGSMQNKGTSEKPWRTLAEVIIEKKINDNDTLFLRNGFHGEKIILAGNHLSPVTIVAEKNHIPIVLQIHITGSGWIVKNITFTNEEVNGTGEPGKFDNGTFLVMSTSSKNNTIGGSNFYSAKNISGWKLEDWRKNVWSGIRDDGKNNIICNNNLINIAFAIDLGEHCINTIVENNQIENFSGDGIRIGGGDYCKILHNTIKNSIELDTDPIVGNHEDGIQSWKGQENDDAVKGLELSGNYILNYTDLNQPFRGILQGIGLFDGPYIDCIIENNIVVVEHAHGITLYGAYNCKIINNTVLPYPGTFPYRLGPPWIMIHAHKDGTSSKGNIVRNNLTSAMAIDSGSCIEDHNVVESVGFKFVNDYNNFDFTPKPGFIYQGKSIIDAGSDDQTPSADFRRSIRRGQGKGIDIGAYEYVYDATQK